MSARTQEAASLVTHSYSTAIKGAQDVTPRPSIFPKPISRPPSALPSKLSDMKSPSHFIELLTEHSRTQFEELTKQTKELAELTQKNVLASAEPLNTGVAKAFSQAA